MTEEPELTGAELAPEPQTPKERERAEIARRVADYREAWSVYHAQLLRIADEYMPRGRPFFFVSE